jgi:hypothetical protein
MRRLLIAALLSLTLPVAAFAAYILPSELLEAIQQNGRGKDFAYEIKGSYEPYSASLSMRGSFQGTTEDARGTWNGTLTYNDGSGAARAKFELRLLDQVLYIKIQSVTGHLDASTRTALQRMRGKWLSTPIDLQSNEERSRQLLGEIDVSEEELKQLQRDIVDAVLSLSHTAQTAGHSYSLRLQRHFLTNAAKVWNAFAKKHGPADFIADFTNAELNRYEKEFLAHLNVHVKVETDANDDFRSVKHYISFDESGFNFLLQGKATDRTAPITVSIPPRAIDIDEFMGTR